MGIRIAEQMELTEGFCTVDEAHSNPREVLCPEKSKHFSESGGVSSLRDSNDTIKVDSF